MVGCIAQYLTTQKRPKTGNKQELYWLKENFCVVQIFQYFEHMQIVQKFEPQKIFPYNMWLNIVYYPIFITQQPSPTTVLQNSL